MCQVVELPPPFRLLLRLGLFLGSMAQCVAWLWARAASLPASASLPPLRPKTKLGHSQTLNPQCLSLHRSPPLYSLFVIITVIVFCFIPIFFICLSSLVFFLCAVCTTANLSSISGVTLHVILHLYTLSRQAPTHRCTIAVPL